LVNVLSEADKLNCSYKWANTVNTYYENEPKAKIPDGEETA